jgi:hypothetical protein
MVSMAELYREYEKIDLAFIRECHTDSGVLRGFIEKCDDDYRRQWAEHFIRVNSIEIENAMEDVEYDRQTASELERLHG